MSEFDPDLNVICIKEETDEAESSDRSFAAEELLQNGIYVETNKGLICMSLNAALREGVGGVTISEQELKSVATKLLSFDNASPKLTVESTNSNIAGISSPSLGCPEAIAARPTRAVPQSRRTLLKRRLNSSLGCSSSQPSTSLSDSGLSSDTSEVLPLASTDGNELPKRRGGWPKGRKRKPENKFEVRQPKAPATGYVLFLNERRKEYKNLRFSEVTKLLGNKWSRLSMNEKRRYLDQAEVDKKRYREELKTYRQSTAYRQFLQRKRLKRLHESPFEESDMDATDEIEDEQGGEELHCQTCNQWFHSLHNKREHMYGRQHLSNIANRDRIQDDMMTTTSFDESSLDATDVDNFSTSSNTPSNMEQAMMNVVSENLLREREIVYLKQKFSEYQIRNKTLKQELEKVNIKAVAAECTRDRERRNKQDTESKLTQLLAITQLFS